MKKALLCFLLCLPLAFAVAAEKKKKVMLTPEQKVEQKKQEAREREEDKKIRYEPSFRIDCRPPVITGEKIVLTALHPLGFRGKPALNEIILRVERSGLKKRATPISNLNYPTNDKGQRTGAELPRAEAGSYVWRYCLGRLPENIRMLLESEQDLL